jgi:hypothetical protein
MMLNDSVCDEAVHDAEPCLVEALSEQAYELI